MRLEGLGRYFIVVAVILGAPPVNISGAELQPSSTGSGTSSSGLLTLAGLMLMKACGSFEPVLPLKGCPASGSLYDFGLIHQLGQNSAQHSGPLDRLGRLHSAAYFHRT